MDYSVTIYLVTVVGCGILMATIQLYPPKTLKWQIGFWCVFVILILLGGYATYWEAQNIQEERGRAQWNLGLNLVHGFVQDRKADRFETLLEESERDKKEARGFQAQRQAKDKRRREAFFYPLAKLLERADGAIVSAKDTRDPESVKRYHEPQAMEWFSEGERLLAIHCSGKVREFKIPPETIDSLGFPSEAHSTTEEIIKFYEVRKALLMDVQRNHAALCGE